MNSICDSGFLNVLDNPCIALTPPAASTAVAATTAIHPPGRNVVHLVPQLPREGGRCAHDDDRARDQSDVLLVQLTHHSSY